MKKTILIGITSVCFWGYSQTSSSGINTITPKNDLHVNGSLQVTNALIVGGDEKTNGDSGTTGAFLISQGNNAPPRWTKTTDAPPRSITLGDTTEATGAVKSTNGSGRIYLGYKMTLPKGKWIVNLGVMVKNNQTVEDRHWLLISLSTSKTSQENNGYNYIGNNAKTPTIAGVILRINNTKDENNNNTFIKGSNVIEVTENEVTVYAIFRDLPTNALEVVPSNQNYMFAIPVN